MNGMTLDQVGAAMHYPGVPHRGPRPCRMRLHAWRTTLRGDQPAATVCRRCPAVRKRAL